jgi:hypothetical protein
MALRDHTFEEHLQGWFAESTKIPAKVRFGSLGKQGEGALEGPLCRTEHFLGS